MKIALCAPTDIHALARSLGQATEGTARGLGSTVTTPLILELLRRGNQVTVYTLSIGDAKDEFYQWKNLRIFVGPFRPQHVARNYFRPEIAYLKRVIQADAPPFVHAHWTYEFSLGALRSHVPTLTTVHDLPWYVLRYYRDPHRMVRLLMAYEVALRGRYFTAVSQYAAEHFRRFFKPGAKIVVIPNGLPSAVFDVANRRPEKERSGITFATILQGWSRLKNAAAVLPAFFNVRREIPSARLLMFGLDYQEGGAAQHWAAGRDLADGVSFVGPLPHFDLLTRVREEVDVIVHPSLNESFGMVALEAMALSKPIIAASTACGVSEVLGRGDCGGVLVDMRDPKAIAETMVRLARDVEYRNRLRNCGYERAASNYRMDTVTTQYEALYKRLCAA